MPKLSHLETLFFYDGPELFLASDQFGTKYVCVLVDDDKSNWKYLCAPSSPSRAEDFAAGGIDLLSVFMHPDVDELYVVEAPEGKLQELRASAIGRSEVRDDWLPDPGFRLDLDSPPEDSIAREAISRNRAIIRWRLSPPESLVDSKIAAEHLSQALSIFQRLVKHAYRKSLRDIDANVRSMLDIPKSPELEVFAFSPGSFTVHMQSTLPADLVGFAEVSRALELIDSVNVRIDDTEEAVKRLAEIGGHFAGAYKNLLRFIQNTGSHVGYEWAQPDMAEAKSHRISTSQAEPLYKAIVKRVEIETEMIVLLGRFTKLDKKLRTWRLLSVDENKEYSGESEVDLAGLTIQTEQYRLHCEERLEEERGTGREETKLILKSVLTA